MYELIQLSQNDYYIDCPSRMGIVRIGNHEVIMIDSGNDKDAGKKALRHIEANGWQLKAIYNTHSHADHIGGNKLLQSRTGCDVYANGIESAFTRHTLLEPAMLFGGMPAEELCKKTYMAQESDVKEMNDDSLPDGFAKVDLPGHSKDMVGIRTPDGNMFIGDALLSEETLNKYPVSYVYDIEAYLKTLEELMEMQAKCFIPSHAEPVSDIKPLAQFNIDTVKTVQETLLQLCNEPVCFDVLLQKVFDKYGITMTLPQYGLIGTTVKSYLLLMRREDRLEMTIENNMILWVAK